MKRLIALFLACILFAGCSKQNRPAGPETVTTVTNAAQIAITPRITEADPETALDKIYESVTISDVKEADARDLSKVFSMDTTLLETSYVRYTSGKFGLANVFILKPKTEDDIMKVSNQLAQVKLAISRETEHFDVYSAYQIAQDAQIYEQGGYLIMLMVADTEAARKIIDTYIPKK